MAAVSGKRLGSGGTVWVSVLEKAGAYVERSPLVIVTAWAVGLVTVTVSVAG